MPFATGGSSGQQLQKSIHKQRGERARKGKEAAAARREQRRGSEKWLGVQALEQGADGEDGELPQDTADDEAERRASSGPSSPAVRSGVDEPFDPLNTELLRRGFEIMDRDDSGGLSIFELQDLLAVWFPERNAQEIQRMTETVFVDIDVDGDDEIQLEELISFFQTKTEGGDLNQMFTQGHVKFLPDTIREWMWAIFEYGSGETYGNQTLRRVSLYTTLSVQAVILLSVINMVLESTRAYTASDGSLGSSSTFNVECFCIGIFTIEFTIRLVSTPSMGKYWKSGFTYIDLLAIVPFYLDIAGVMGDSAAASLPALRILRLMRLVRILRVAKLGKNAEGVQLMVVAVTRARLALIWAAVLIAMSVVTFGAVMWYMEKDETMYDPDYCIGNDCGFWVRINTTAYSDAGQAIFMQSIPDAMWWALVTLTTVGYGDSYPITSAGRFVAAITMGVGLLVLSYPVTILCTHFAEVQQEFDAQKLRRKRRENFKHKLEEANMKDTGRSMRVARTKSLLRFASDDMGCTSGILGSGGAATAAALGIAEMPKTELTQQDPKKPAARGQIGTSPDVKPADAKRNPLSALEAAAADLDVAAEHGRREGDARRHSSVVLLERHRRSTVSGLSADVKAAAPAPRATGGRSPPPGELRLDPADRSQKTRHQFIQRYGSINGSALWSAASQASLPTPHSLGEWGRAQLDTGAAASGAEDAAGDPHHDAPHAGGAEMATSDLRHLLLCCITRIDALSAEVAALRTSQPATPVEQSGRDVLVGKAGGVPPAFAGGAQPEPLRCAEARQPAPVPDGPSPASQESAPSARRATLTGGDFSEDLAEMAACRQDPGGSHGHRAAIGGVIGGDGILNAPPIRMPAPPTYVKLRTLDWVKAQFDESDTAQIITEADGKLVRAANAACSNLTGYSVMEMIGKRIPDLLQGPCSSPHVIADLRNAVVARTCARAQMLNYRKDGAEFLNLIRFQPIVGPDGGALYWGLLRDESPSLPHEVSSDTESMHSKQAFLTPHEPL